MAERPADLIYSVDERPPARRLAVLGIQYALLCANTLVMLLIFARSAGLSAADSQTIVSLGLIAMAIGAVVQAWRGRLFGSGYLALPAFSAIYLGPAILAAKTGGLPAVAGMTVFAGLVEIALARLLPRLRVVFQPMISGLIILLVGIELGLIGMGHLLDVSEQGSAVYAAHVTVSVVTFAVAIGLSVWGRGTLRLMCSLLAVIAGVVAAFAVGLLGPDTFADLVDVPWFAIPDFGIIAYDFDLSLVPVFLAAGAAAAIRSTGVFATAQRANDLAWKRPDVENLRRGIFGDGVGAVAAGLLNTIGMSVAPSIVGMSVVTGATSRVIAFACAAFLVLFALIPKIAAAVVHLPLEILGGLLLFSASLMIASGIQVITTHRLDTRATIVVAVSLLLGLMTRVQPEFFAHLPAAIRTVASSTLTLSLATAIVLTLLFRIGIRRRDAMPWQTVDGAALDLQTLLDRECKSWKLAGDTVQRARETVTDLVTHLHDGRYLDEPRTITSSFDDIELRIDLTYRGRPVHLTSPGSRPTIFHQETAGADGALALAVHADRASVASHGEEIHVRLSFEA